MFQIESYIGDKCVPPMKVGQFLLHIVFRWYSLIDVTKNKWLVTSYI